MSLNEGSAAPIASPASTAVIWTGRVVSLIPTLLLVMGGVMKVMQNPMVTDGLVKAGYDPNVAFGLGVVELISAALYLIPQTAAIGAILLTGYLGGAIATHVRLGEEFTAPAVLAVVFWLGLVLRQPRRRSILPWK